MCTLAIYFQTASRWPIVLAANRDEFLDRPAAEPTTLADHPYIVGGKDLRAGGTWLGINEHGLVAGLLNRRATAGADPKARSRGLLCLDALRCRGAHDAVEFVRAQRAQDYNPFNLLIASREHAFVAHNRAGRIDLVQLATGLHMLTNLDVDDFECPKISRAYERFAELGARDEFRRDPVAMRSELAALLADHSTQLDSRNGEAGSARSNALCLHLDGYGTRSSSLIFIGADSAQIEHFFAPGPPCRTAFAPAAVPTRAGASAAHGSR
jgi:uncharacterized protein with NRDE domain